MLTQLLINREVFFYKDFQEEKQLQGIKGSNNSKVYQIILQINECTDPLVKTNFVKDFVNE